MNVRWKSITNTVMNGITTRQGNVFFSSLFCICMRDVSGTIANSILGCHIAGLPIDILLYADES
jgi:hypothetical protein